MEKPKCNYLLVLMHCHFEYFMEYLGHLERVRILNEIL